MRTVDFSRFYATTRNKNISSPFSIQLELTYRCNLNCVHCYCLGAGDESKELDINEVKKILDDLRQQGCLQLTFSGGEPLLRGDFLEIYAHAKKNGFLITIFTNGQLFNKRIIEYLVKAPPYAIEITLNGISKGTYENITRVKGSFLRVIENIKILAKNKLPLILKTNLLKQNQKEIAKIKMWAEAILGKPGRKHYFKYDPFIYPRLNGDTSPLKFRLSFKEILSAIKEDPDMFLEHQKEMCKDFSPLQKPSDYLYHCESWMHQAFINPYGRLKFCLFSERFSLNLRKGTFEEGFYKLFPRVSEEKFKTDSTCRNCSLRTVCRWCPAMAYLETGDEEKQVFYYCRLAREVSRETYKARKIVAQ